MCKDGHLHCDSRNAVDQCRSRLELPENDESHLSATDAFRYLQLGPLCVTYRPHINFYEALLRGRMWLREDCAICAFGLFALLRRQFAPVWGQSLWCGQSFRYLGCVGVWKPEIHHLSFSTLNWSFRHPETIHLSRKISNFPRDEGDETRRKRQEDKQKSMDGELCLQVRLPHRAPPHFALEALWNRKL